jgi:hypothetical protein
MVMMMLVATEIVVRLPVLLDNPRYLAGAGEILQYPVYGGQPHVPDASPGLRPDLFRTQDGPLPRHHLEDRESPRCYLKPQPSQQSFEYLVHAPPNDLDTSILVFPAGNVNRNYFHLCGVLSERGA